MSAHPAIGARRARETGAAAPMVRRVEGGRLAYYRAAADERFWDAHWETRVSAETYAGARRGELPFIEGVLLRHLPREGRILEAGCGLGQYVLGLSARGYPCEGVEWSRATVERVRAVVPELAIRTGDVTALDVPDGHYAGYISLGVVEHRQAGPDPFLQEAWRVLRPGGVALIAVPHLHALRRVKATVGWYRGRPTGLEFYQYAYSGRQMRAFLAQAGFRVIETRGYDPYKGLKDEWRGMVRVFRLPVVGRRLERWWRRSRWAKRHVGHMMMYVCRKEAR